MTHATEASERSCPTCAHIGVHEDEEPCRSCLAACPGWQPKPPEPPCPGATPLGEYNTPNGRRDAWWVSGAVLIGECAWTPEHIAHPTLIKSDWRPVYRAALARAEELGLVEPPGKSRGCETCKHLCGGLSTDPCSTCTGYSNWQPKPTRSLTPHPAKAEADTANWWHAEPYLTLRNALFTVGAPNPGYWAYFVWSALPEPIRVALIRFHGTRA